MIGVSMNDADVMFGKCNLFFHVVLHLYQILWGRSWSMLCKVLPLELYHQLGLELTRLLLALSNYQVARLLSNSFFLPAVEELSFWMKTHRENATSDIESDLDTGVQKKKTQENAERMQRHISKLIFGHWCPEKNT